MINWGKIEKEEAVIVSEIAKRACEKYGVLDFLSLSMDICAAHSVASLDLFKLSEFEDFDFYHDIFGISRHIDRDTGKMQDCFLPRCSA